MSKQNNTARKKILLTKFFNDTLSPEERKDLHDFAAKDPFLAHALKGYQEFREDPTPYLDQLRSHTRQVSNKPKFRWQTWAAILLPVGLISVAIWLMLSNKSQQSEIAVITESLSHQDSLLALSDNEVAGLEYDFSPAESKQEHSAMELEEEHKPRLSKPDVKLKDKHIIQNRSTELRAKPAPHATTETDQSTRLQSAAQTEEQVSESMPNPDKPQLNSVDTIQFVTVDIGVDTKIDSSSVEYAHLSSTDDVLGKSKRQSSPIRFPKLSELTSPVQWNGSIVDMEGQPMSGVHITWNEMDSTFTSRSDGSFLISLSKFPTVVNFNHPDYHSKVLEVREDTELPDKIHLQPEIVLNEVQEIKSKEERVSEPSRLTDSASPKPSFKAFLKYIRKNRKIPVAAKEAKLSGKVQVTFRVNPDGSIDRFRITRSLGYGCDEEAIRLLEDGPKWKINQNIKEPVEMVVEIPFDHNE